MRFARLTDKALFDRAKNGETAAFEEFFRRHATFIHRWMVRMVGRQDADDLVQVVFMKAYRGLARFRINGSAEPRSWLCTSAANTVKNYYRSRANFRRVFADNAQFETSALEPDRDPEEQVLVWETMRNLAEAMEMLSSEDRLVLELHDVLDESYRKISLSLGIPEHRVRARASRRRAQLRTFLLPSHSGR